jgi:glycosyltransferase involved in cell wall biosynthesis
MNFPKITIVTPVFNDKDFIENTILSVINQNYPNLEYIIVDGGSTDGTLEIIKKYSDHLSLLISEKDRGHGNAINKGFAVSTGEIMGWINGNDVLLPGNLFLLAEIFSNHPQVEWLTAQQTNIDEHGRLLYVFPPKRWNVKSFILEEGHKWIQQESTYWRRSLWTKAGGYVADNLKLSSDFELWVRFFRHAPLFSTYGQLGAFRYHGEQRSTQIDDYNNEVNGILKAERKDYQLPYYFKHFKNQAPPILCYNKETKKIEFQDLTPELYRTTQNQDNSLIFVEADERSFVGTADKRGDFKFTSLRAADSYYVQDNKKSSWIGYFVPRNFNRLFNRSFVELQLERSRNLFNKLITDRKNDTCIIVGNGPSLNKINFELLKGQDVFICNYAYIHPKLLEYAKYWSIVNFTVAEQGSDEIKKLKGIIRFAPYWLAHVVTPDENTCYFETFVRPVFSTDVTDWISWMSTVTFFNMQLAYGLGYRRVLLIGFDHSFSQPPECKGGETIYQKENDSNHFHPDYFKNKTWQAANISDMDMVYRFAREAFENDGREIINCTVGGKLEVFPRQEFVKALNSIESTQRNANELIPVNNESKILVIIDPDALDHFGHYLAYDIRISEAARELGFKSIILGHKGFKMENKPTVVESLMKVFSLYSWQIASRRNEPNIDDIISFRNEFSNAISKIRESYKDSEIAIYMYTGSLDHAEVINDVIAKYDNIYANINLFWLFMKVETDQDFIQRWQPFMQKVGVNESKVKITMPTKKMRDDYASVFNIYLPLAPHPSTTFSDPEAKILVKKSNYELQTPPTILFPGGMRPEKGFELSIKTAITLSAARDRKCILRSLSRPETPKDMIGLIELLDGTNVEVVSNVFDDNEFQLFLSNGDIIVLPYTAPIFSRRTSGILIDAMLLGRPVVAIKGTWLGDFVTEKGFGIAAEYNVDSLMSAIETILSDYSTFSKSIVKSKNDYLREHSWERLLQSVLDISSEYSCDAELQSINSFSYLKTQSNNTTNIHTLDSSQSCNYFTNKTPKYQFNGIIFSGDLLFGQNTIKIKPYYLNNWLAFKYLMKINKGDYIFCKIILKATSNGYLQFMLCRHGESVFEHTNKMFQIKMGINIIKIGRRFNTIHEGFRIQIGARDNIAEFSNVEIYVYKNQFDNFVKIVVRHLLSIIRHIYLLIKPVSRKILMSLPFAYLFALRLKNRFSNIYKKM